MDKNTIIGLLLIFGIFMVWQRIMAPDQEELEAQQRIQDSLALEQLRADSIALMTLPEEAKPEAAIPQESDSVKVQRLGGDFGPFATAAQGSEQIETIENDLLKISFSTKGGRIIEVELKEYFKVRDDKELKKEVKSVLKLLEDEKNRFEYFLPVASLPSGGVSTADLFFTVSKNGNSISFKADAGNGRYFEQKYSLSPGSYQVDYEINFEGLNNVIARNADEIQLSWLNYLGKLEKSSKYERNYSTVYYKPVDDDYDYCSCTSDDTEDLKGKSLKWIAHSNQFFISSLIASQSFNSAVLETKLLDEDGEDLKRLQSEIKIPYGHSASERFAMNMYIGPKKFDLLYAMGHDLEDVIPFGRSIFGSINRWVIRPIFDFLSRFIGSKGIVILFLTFIVKLLLYPLTYKMLYSQSKMGALKPQLSGMKEKFKDDSQKQQMESMKLYREFGVNPLGGCMPMVLQMPIWFALYRFFPASIEFRQAGFLWATDLSSYDVIARLPFEVPMGFGSHISLFTILWAVTTLVYTYYNTKHMDMTANPAMKYMQYLMPIFFLGFFNSYASGLTCYLFFSNILNITQTVVTKEYIIDKEKIKRELEAYKKKPKKKGGFQQRLETVMKEQQKVQSQRGAQNKKKRKKR